MGPKPALVSLHPDGSVLVTAGGTEMGQGLFTKVKQVGAVLFQHINTLKLVLQLCRVTPAFLCTSVALFLLQLCLS